MIEIDKNQGDGSLGFDQEIEDVPEVQEVYSSQTKRPLGFEGEEENQENRPPGLYDLVYGVLFDPADTFRRVAVSPPVGLTLALVLGLNLVLAIMGMVTTDYQPLAGNMMGYTNERLISTMQSMAPMMAMVGFVINALVWFVYSGVLHLIAEFYGGQGRAISTFTAYGLAGLPALFLLPLQGMEIIFAGSSFFNILSIIGTLVVIIWGIVLLAIGIREVHNITTGKAVLVVVTPWLVGIMLLIIIVLMLIGVISSALPYIEQFSKI